MRIGLACGDFFQGKNWAAKLQHLASKHIELLELIHQYLAANQIQRLNTGGALIQGGNAAVPENLLHAPLLDITMAAKYLNTVIGCLNAQFSDKTF